MKFVSRPDISPLPSKKLNFAESEETELNEPYYKRPEQSLLLKAKLKCLKENKEARKFFQNQVLTTRFLKISKILKMKLNNLLDNQVMGVKIHKSDVKLLKKRYLIQKKKSTQLFKANMKLMLKLARDLKKLQNDS